MYLDPFDGPQGMNLWAEALFLFFLSTISLFLLFVGLRDGIVLPLAALLGLI